MAENFNIVLYEPEIPPNTGNIIRLAANTNCQLHLIEPLGFELGEKSLRRAGLDYHEWAKIKVHKNFDDYIAAYSGCVMYAATTKAQKYYSAIDFPKGCSIIFGPESRGLPSSILESPQITSCIKIPMQIQSRSLNLSNSVAVILYEALRQINFPEFV